MSDKVDLKGKSAIVTGASRGIGKRVAIRLAAHGAKVALVARSADALAELERSIRASGGAAHAIAGPIDSAAAVDAIKQRVEKAVGTPTILVNAAGIFGPIQAIKDSDPARWIETITVNAIAPYLMCRAFTGGMIAKKWGRIVNVTSAAALHPPGPLNSAYGTSKVALNHMTRHLAAELKGTGVTANVFHPGDVKTDMWAAIRDEAEQLGPEAEGYRQWVNWVGQTGGDDPEKAADLVLRLISDQGAAISGQFLWIEEPLQKPIPSWGEVAEPPWKK